MTPTEVWIDDDALVRRMRQRFAGTPEMTVTLDFFDFGAREEVDVPARAVDVTDELAAATP